MRVFADMTYGRMYKVSDIQIYQCFLMQHTNIIKINHKHTTSDRKQGYDDCSFLYSDHLKVCSFILYFKKQFTETLLVGFQRLDQRANM